MKKIIIFGATGRTGIEVVKQALEKDYHVTAIVRNPDKFELSHPNLSIVKGDVLQHSSYENELAGQTAVISCLGGGAAKLYSDGIKNIMAAMEKANVKRLLCISSITANSKVGPIMWLMMKFSQTVYRGIAQDMKLMESIVSNSNTNWTIVRPTMLNNEPYTGKYRIAINEHIKKPWSISRADVADLMLKSIEDTNTYGAIVEVS